MQAQEIFEKLQEEFGDAIIELAGEAPSDPYIKVNPEKIFDISLFLRDTDGLQFGLSCLLERYGLR